MSDLSVEDVRAAILSLACQRGPEKSFCPSEAARRLDPVRWRELMEAIHRETEKLYAVGMIVVLQKGRAVDPATVRGPVRLRLRHENPDTNETG